MNGAFIPLEKIFRYFTRKLRSSDSCSVDQKRRFFVLFQSMSSYGLMNNRKTMKSLILEQHSLCIIVGFRVKSLFQTKLHLLYRNGMVNDLHFTSQPSQCHTQLLFFINPLLKSHILCRLINRIYNLFKMCKKFILCKSVPI